MKFGKYISALLITFGLALSSYAQSTGELNRFATEELSSYNEVSIFNNASYIDIKIKNATIDKATLTVHNIIGNVVQVVVEDLGNHEYRLNTDGLTPGYYLIAIKDDKNILKKTYKFSKR